MRQSVFVLCGAVHERAGTEPGERVGARGSAAAGGCGIYRSAVARADGEFVRRSECAEDAFFGLAGSSSGSTGIRRVRFTTSHPQDFGKDIVEAIEAVPA